ncbi:MAG: transcription antitermination factor NusB [Anaerolineales bacterium]|nr:transcription antitermination factor NusB [Anaerolineales bacterium]MCB9145138.1 transcription antitermination factor NusB [Anaerolineales bacterium]
MKPRTQARSIALQVLYETDLSTHLPGDVLQLRLEETTLSLDLVEFARGIIFGVMPIRDHLDHVIAKYAPEWPMDQVAAIDRNILRMACWEFAVSRETPVKVAINEAVELAKLFGSDSTARFVNGVLGTLVKHEQELREVLKNEISQTSNLES